jgi:prepilin-type N-terminal cleavage/methylation domain-containing protein
MNDDIRGCIRRRGTGGFTLVEILIVIMVIAILAVCMVLVISPGKDNTEASAIMADLDAARKALLTYSREHRTRTSDALGDFMGANSKIIAASLDKYLNVVAGSKAGARFDTISVAMSDGDIRIGFVNFPMEQGVINALKRKADSGSGYDFEENGTACSLWLKIK